MTDNKCKGVNGVELCDQIKLHCENRNRNQAGDLISESFNKQTIRKQGLKFKESKVLDKAGL